MYNKSFFKLFAVTCLTICSIEAVPLKGHTIKFHPISRAQYESILDLTDGKPVISEARLISSGSFKSLNELRSTISHDISSGWRHLLNATGLGSYNTNTNTNTNTKKGANQIEGYPLCVIRTTDLEVLNDNEEAKQASADYYDDGIDEPEPPMPPADDDKYPPVVNCIVVMKPKQPKPENGEDPQQPETHIEYFNPYAGYGGYPQQYYNYGEGAYPYAYKGRSRLQARTSKPYHKLARNSNALAGKEEDEEVEKDEGKSNTADAYQQLEYQQILSNYYQQQSRQYGGYPYNYPQYGYNPYAQAYNPAGLYGQSLAYPAPTYAQSFGSGSGEDDSQEEGDYSGEVDGHDYEETDGGYSGEEDY